MTDLAALIARVEALSGPDREVDCLVYALVHLRGPFVIVGPPTYDPPRFFCNPSPEIDWIGYDLLYVSSHVTASLDAVVELCARVKPSWRWAVTNADGPNHWPAQGELWISDHEYIARHATPALALLLALLRAVQAQQETEA